MKVVMVDDSTAERKLCRLLLEETHSAMEFVEAETAAEGLEAVRASAPDCVLLDYRLPDMTGLDFLRRMGEEPAAHVAVVMLTGVTGEEIAVEAMKAGAQDYLVKDRITAESLSLAIQKATQKVGLMHALEAERDRLARSLSEKEVLLQEVHHRVKNNLQVVASLLRLQAERLDGEPAAEALRSSQWRVESMAMIHEQLYESHDLRQVNLAEHASLLLGNLLNAYGCAGRIAGRVTMEPLVLGVDQAIPAGLILNELISNAFKHAFPAGRSGQIGVGGGLSAGVVTLSVWNDGRELPADFAPQKSTSLGLRIVQTLTRQLKGTFQFDRRGDQAGTTFRIAFPAVPLKSKEAAGGNDAAS